MGITTPFAPPSPFLPAGWYLVNVRVPYLGVSLILRFIFPGIQFVYKRLHNLGWELMSKPYWSLLKRFLEQMNTVNSLRLKIRWSHTPLLEILLCSHWMKKPEHLTCCDPGLTWVMDSWGPLVQKSLDLIQRNLGIPMFWVTPSTNPSWCGFPILAGQCYGWSSSTLPKN